MDINAAITISPSGRLFARHGRFFARHLCRGLVRSGQAPSDSP